jgi:hypothetical protein
MAIKMLLLALSFLAINSYADLTNPGAAPQNAAVSFKKVLTPEQRAARKEFKERYHSSSDSVKAAMKAQLKSDQNLRTKLGLKPLPAGAPPSDPGMKK